MNKQELADKAREALRRYRQLPAEERFQRLVDAGIIDERGRVRDQVRFWHAHLAVVEIERSSDGKRIDCFRCLKPAFGLPGSATIDVSRDNLVKDIKEGRRIITAYQKTYPSDGQTHWIEGEDIRLTSSGYLRTDANDVEEDNLGNLPTFNCQRNNL